MHKSTILPGLFLLMLSSAGYAQGQNPEAARPTTAAAGQRVELTSPEDEVFYAIGYASSGKFSKLSPSEKEVRAALQGLRDGLEQKKSIVNIMTMQEQVDRVTGARLKAFDGKLAKEGRQFYDEFVKSEEVIVTASGLAYRIVEPGSGKSVRSESDYVEVHYSGKLHNGTVFDASVEEGKPARFKVGTLLKGWREGLALISEGGRISMVLPPGLAYGTHGRAPLVPPNGTLQFDIQLLTVMDEATARTRAASERKPMGHSRFHGAIKTSPQVPSGH